MSLPMKRSFSSEGGATSKRDWKMRLSLRSRSGHSVGASSRGFTENMSVSSPATEVHLLKLPVAGSTPGSLAVAA
ncbi:hypothetical protein SFRURICE_015820 [Spodoptera frugiperda]|uniref:SFRICE_040199 n=1 Tax=Spodoptera frugiperda TaxID=7108 RepID=A0A2H1VR48_SPOFR|nr:hypothetical protein SFRURICE_015820 [Spodoptera frugiperda]